VEGLTGMEKHFKFSNLVIHLFLLLLAWQLAKRIATFDLQTHDIILFCALLTGAIGVLLNKPYWFVAVTIIFWQEFFLFQKGEPLGYAIPFGFLNISDVFVLVWAMIFVLQFIKGKATFPGGFVKKFFIGYSLFIGGYVIYSVVMFGAGPKDLFNQLRYWMYLYAFFPMINTIRNEDDLNGLLRSILVLLVPFVMLSLFLYFSDARITWSYLQHYNPLEGSRIASGFIQSRNPSPTVALAFIFLVSYVAFFGLRSMKRIDIYVFPVSLFLINIITTFGRAFLSAVMVGIFLALVLVRKVRGKGVIGAAVVLVIITIAVLVPLNRYFSAVDALQARFQEGVIDITRTEGTFGDRVTKALRGIREHPTAGTGFWAGRTLGRYQPVYFRVMLESFWGQYILRFGGLGLIFFFVFFIGFFRFIYRTIAMTHNELHQAFLIGFLGYLVGGLFWGIASAAVFLRAHGMAIIVLMLVVTYKVYEFNAGKLTNSRG